MVAPDHRGHVIERAQVPPERVHPPVAEGPDGGGVVQIADGVEGVEEGAQVGHPPARYSRT